MRYLCAASSAIENQDPPRCQMSYRERAIWLCQQELQNILLFSAGSRSRTVCVREEMEPLMHLIPTALRCRELLVCFWNTRVSIKVLFAHTRTYALQGEKKECILLGNMLCNMPLASYNKVLCFHCGFESSAQKACLKVREEWEPMLDFAKQEEPCGWLGSTAEHKPPFLQTARIRRKP